MCIEGFGYRVSGFPAGVENTQKHTKTISEQKQSPFLSHFRGSVCFLHPVFTSFLQPAPGADPATRNDSPGVANRKQVDIFAVHSEH
jgi:hypothetical protein